MQASFPASLDGDPSFRIVGLPDSALREGRERIRAAVVHEGWMWPPCPVTVNLAPASARKQGAGLDLPIALAVLEAGGVLSGHGVLRPWLCVGELTLDGRIRPVRGVLAAVETARRAGLARVLVPPENAREAAAVHGVEVFAPSSLAEAVGHLSGRRPLERTTPAPWQPACEADGGVGVRGQPAARLAARVAAAGGHNLLLWGPPGAGKTLLARQLRAWLPPLTYEEALEVSRIHSIAGLLDGALVTRRPFRAPHHTTSLAGLIGGGPSLRPGEVSLAHLGVLFLDELPEFQRSSLEALRQPLEDGRLVIGRAAGRAAFPAEVILVGASNPCPCGYYGDRERCTCREAAVRRYQGRLSGPIRDRFDLEIQVPAVDAETLVATTDPEAPDLETEAREAERARRAQAERARRLRLPRAANARIPPSLLPGAVQPTRAAQADLVRQARVLGLSGRGVHRVLRVARTVADLDGSEHVEPEHVLRVMSWRS